ncbi:MAG: SUMF1/EgtB/PvdO family nonheme iron enzyme [Bryobacteraceae bacterium]
MDDIGRYRIIGELGSGGMGIVYRAYDPVLGREVAIKTLKLSELSDPAEREALRERLGREARAAAALSHHGIVTIHDVVQQGDLICLVMERIEGQTLAHVLLTQPPLDVNTVFRIIREAASALDYAHRKGIVHRDIKPANIMLDESGAVKIADFGIAKITTSNTRTQSASGLIVGTAGYMSPEQLRGATIEGHADQFSLAVVAYEMLVNRRPFMADSLIALTHQVVFEEPPTLSTLRPGLGVLADAVFHKALAKNPADRFPTCSAFAAALESQINAAISAPTLAFQAAPLAPQNPTQNPTQQRAPARSGWVTAVIAIVAILVIAGVAAVYFFRRTPAVQQAPARQPDPPPIVAAKTAPVVEQPEPVKPSPDPPASNPAKAKAPVATAVLKAGTVRVNKKDGQKYVWIPPGSFVMGCVPADQECGAAAKPAHHVTITTGFWMAQTLTTVASYKAFSEATQREMPKTPKFNPKWALPDHPMVELSWDDATAYCSRAGGRLPTEAEWEYAARGDSPGTVFPWGNDPSHDLANFGEGTSGNDEQGAVGGKDQWINTSPVASFAPNGFKLYDMVGNASEWCSDWSSPSYYRQSPEKDPKGPETGTFRIVRGGSWKSPARFMHISFRGNRPPQERGLTTGCRCVVNTLP